MVIEENAEISCTAAESKCEPYYGEIIEQKKKLYIEKEIDFYEKKFKINQNDTYQTTKPTRKAR